MAAPSRARRDCVRGREPNGRLGRAAAASGRGAGGRAGRSLWPGRRLPCRAGAASPGAGRQCGWRVSVRSAPGQYRRCEGKTPAGRTRRWSRRCCGWWRSRLSPDRPLLGGPSGSLTRPLPRPGQPVACSTEREETGRVGTQKVGVFPFPRPASPLC